MPKRRHVQRKRASVACCISSALLDMQQHCAPVMLVRAPLGTMEDFLLLCLDAEVTSYLSMTTRIFGG
jgi:hypothetical protein